jgi:hypothetical protein
MSKNKVTNITSSRGADGTLKTKAQNKKKWIINLKERTFNEQDVETYEWLYETLWSESEPKHFGDEIHPAIRFLHFELKPIKSTVAQDHRKGGRVKDPKNVFRSLDKGFKLTELPPSELRVGTTDTQLTGDTRKEYFSANGHENYIAAIYVPVEGATEWEVEDAISYMGQTLQEEPASNPNSMEDVKDALTVQSTIFKESGGKAGVNPLSIEDLLARTERIGFRFTEGKRHDIAYSVYNQFNPSTPVASWSSNPKAHFQIKAYMTQFKLQNSKDGKVIYMCSAASTISKVFTSALRKAAANPNAEIRIVLHTSTLTGTDPLTSFETVAKNNIDKFNTFMSDANIVLNGDGNSRISIYGLLPAVGSAHSFDEPVLYDPITETLYQRKGNYFCDISTEDDQ